MAKHYQWMTSEVGTPYYVAPEVLTQQVHGNSSSSEVGGSNNDDDRAGYTTKCDIWSIGVLAFLTLTGTFPVMGKDERETIQKLMEPDLTVDFSNEKLWEQDNDENH